jgi:hypothetical protein
MANKLAAAVRAKYPGVYDDLDDATLASKVKAKFPGVYDDLDTEDGPADGGFVPPMPALPGVPSARQPQRPIPPGMPGAGGKNEPSTFAGGFVKQLGQEVKNLGTDFVDAAYTHRPTKVVERDMLPSTVGTVVGAGLAATGVGAGVAIPAGGAATTVTAYGRNLVENLIPGGNYHENPFLEAAKEGAIETGVGLATLGMARGASSLGRTMYRGALGATSEAPKAVDELVETGIRERLNVTRGGRTKALSRIDSLNDAVRAQIEGINTHKIDGNIGLENIKRLRAHAEASLAPPAELKAIDDVLADYTQRLGGKQFEPIAGHDMKVGLQSRLAKAFESDAPALAGKAAQMEMASGLRESVEIAGKRAASTGRTGVAAGNIGETNARIGKLHEFEEALKGADARVRPGDVSSLAYLPPQYTVARMGLKSGPMSYIGRNLARLGDAVDPATYGKALGVDDAGLKQAPTRAPNTGFRMNEEEAANALAGATPDNDDWVRLATDGSGRNTKAPPSLGPDESGLDILREANVPELDRLGIPVERPGPALTAFDRNFPVERLPEDGSLVDVLGQPSRRPTPEDVAWQRVMDQRKAEAEAAERAAGVRATDARRTEAYGIQGEWDRKAQEPVQMMLGEPGAEFQMPLRETEQYLPVRDTNPLQRPAAAPPDRFMSAPAAEPPPAAQGVKSVVMEEADNVPLKQSQQAAPRATASVNAAPVPESRVFIVKAGQKPRAVAPGQADKVALGPGERLAMRKGEGPELTLVNQADVVGLSDGSNPDAASFYALRDWEKLQADPGYAYHGTNAENASGIAADGRLRTHRPGYGTDQGAWPDGATEKRAYFAQSPSSAANFPPEGGQAALLRMPRKGLHSESGTGDLYSRAPRTADVLEYADADGRWHDVRSLSDGSNAGAADFYTDPDAYQGMSIELLDDTGLGVNASGESAASAEAISRLAGMKSRGEQFAVMTRDGRYRPLIGADAVDYVPRNGETFGILTKGPDGRPVFQRR